MKKSSGIMGYVCAVCATALWSGNYIIARGLSDEIPPVSLAFLRCGVAIAAFLPFAIKPLIRDFILVKRHILFLSITSLSGISLFSTIIYFAGRSTTATNLSIIAITFPVFIIIISGLFLKEKISFRQTLGVLLVFTGALILISKGNIAGLFSVKFAHGDFWMLIAAIFFAVYSILLKYKPKGFGIWSFQCCTFVLGLVCLAPFFVMESVLAPPVVFTQTIVFSIIYAGVFASFASFVLWNKAISLIGPIRAGMIYYLLPAFSSILAFLFLGEKAYWYHYLSMSIIVGGIIYSTASKER